MFEHLKKLEVADKSAWIDLPEIAPGARVRCRFAGQSNRQYFNARLRLSAQRPGVSNPEQALSLNRADDRQVYPTAIMFEFQGIVDAQGAPVPYSPEAARDLVNCLPDWLFDRIRDRCENPVRFLDQAEQPADPKAIVPL